MKLKETTAVIEALGALVIALVALAIAIGKSIRGSTDQPGKEEPAKEPAAKGKGKGKTAPPPEEEEEEEEDAGGLLDDNDEEEEEEEEPSISMSDLKAIGQKLLKAGKADKLKSVLKKAGAENLGGLDEGKYATVHAALTKALG
jgi:hypothetical protein